MKKIILILLAAHIIPSLIAGEVSGKKTLVKYPGVEIDLAKKEIRVQATVSNALGWRNAPIEFILFRGKEKDYETLFTTIANPTHIQVGLILLGLRPGPLPKLLLEKIGKPESYPADMPAMVNISVIWKDKAGNEKSAPLASLLRSRKDNKQPEIIDFAFTGSRFTKNAQGKNVLVSDLTGEIATLIYNPESLLNLAYFEPSPYTSESGGFKIIPDQLPAEFITEVEMDDYEKGKIKRITPVSYDVTLILKAKE